MSDDHVVSTMSASDLAAAFARRPGMFIGVPVRFDRVVAHIRGYILAVEDVRAALAPGHAGAHHPVGLESQYRDQLRAEGRLRWDRWDLTIVAEAIGWDQEEPPVLDDLSEDQHRAAISQLRPLLERVFALPGEVALAVRPDTSGVD